MYVYIVCHYIWKSPSPYKEDKTFNIFMIILCLHLYLLHQRIVIIIFGKSSKWQNLNEEGWRHELKEKYVKYVQAQDIRMNMKIKLECWRVFPFHIRKIEPDLSISKLALTKDMDVQAKHPVRYTSHDSKVCVTRSEKENH